MAAAIAFTFKIDLKRRGVNIAAFNIEQLSQFTIGRQHRLRYEVLESDIRERNHPGRRSLFEMTSNLRRYFRFGIGSGSRDGDVVCTGGASHGESSGS